MPLMQTSGNVTADAYAGGAAAKVNYIEDCFVTWLSTGNGTSRTVTGPDMTAGGLSITKSRSAAAGWHWVDTARGAGLSLSSNTISAQATESTGVTAFTATGTSIGSAAEYNTNGATYVDCLLKKQPKFFDAVTYTGTGSPTTIAHSLGSAPGCIIVKRTDSTSNWIVYHRGISNSYLKLDLTSANDSANAPAAWGNDTVLIAPTSSVFYVGSGQTNQSGATYVAYLFAHDAGGFGLTGTDNVISCGALSVTSSSGITNVNLGFEPQWILTKVYNQSGYNWAIYDTMRGWVATTGGNFNARLNPNNSNAETSDQQFQPNATGFQCNNSAVFTGSQTDIIYIAIRRGPMKVPTDATKVFVPVTRTGNAGTATVTAGFPVDTTIIQDRQDPYGAQWFDRLRGAPRLLWSWTTAAEQTAYPNTLTGFDNQTGVYLGSDSYVNAVDPYINYFLRRAPGFFDEVCYTGAGSATTQPHNLGVAPELMIFKARNGSFGWAVSIPSLGTNRSMQLQSTLAAYSSELYTTAQSATTVTLTNESKCNASGNTFVAYLFASCPGVSKVGSYTGTGATQTISCGFTGGARFVLIKRTDSTGDWHVWDTARGMVSGTDPSLLLNSTAAEVNANSVYTTTGGFQIVSTAAGINASGGTYIFLAIA